jgi:hypothetical protein
LKIDDVAFCENAGATETNASFLVSHLFFGAKLNLFASQIAILPRVVTECRDTGKTGLGHLLQHFPAEMLEA